MAEQSSHEAAPIIPQVAGDGGRNGTAAGGPPTIYGYRCPLLLTTTSSSSAPAPRAWPRRSSPARARPARPRAPPRRRASPGAKILVSGGGRCNVTKRGQRRRDFNGGRPGIDPPGPARVARVDATVDVLPRSRRRPARGAGRQAVPRLQSLARRPRRAARAKPRRPASNCDAGHRVTSRRPRADGRLRRSRRPGRPTSTRAVSSWQPAACRCPRPAATAAATRLPRRLGHTLVPTTPALVPLLRRPAGAPAVSRRRSAACRSPSA